MDDKDRRYKKIVLFMVLFFMLGGITRGFDLDNKFEWLRGFPAIAGALMLFTPIMFSMKQITKRDFWPFNLIALGRAIVILLDLSVVIAFLFLGIISYSQ